MFPLASGRTISTAPLRMGINEVKFPPLRSPHCVDIVKAASDTPLSVQPMVAMLIAVSQDICQHQPADRLPMLAGGTINSKAPVRIRRRRDTW